jgi:hypothetical protein
VVTTTTQTAGARDYAAGAITLSNGGHVALYITATFDIDNPYDPLFTMKGVHLVEHAKVYGADGLLINDFVVNRYEGTSVNVSDLFATSFNDAVALGGGYFGVYTVASHLEPNPVLIEGDEQGGWLTIQDAYDFVIYNSSGSRTSTIPIPTGPGKIVTFAPATTDDGSLFKFELTFDNSTGTPTFRVDVTVYDDTFRPVATQTLPLDPTFFSNGLGDVTPFLLANGDLAIAGRDGSFTTLVKTYDILAAALQPDSGVPENSPGGTLVGQIKIIGHKASNIQSLTLSGPDADKFVLSPDLKLYVAAGAKIDFEERQFDQLVLKLTDNTGKVSDIPLSVPVNDLNDAPTDITLSKSSFLISKISLIDFLPFQTLGSLTTIDQDAGDTFHYALIDSAGGLFALDGDRIVVNNPLILNALDKTTSYTIQVRTTDRLGLEYTKALKLNFVTDNTPFAGGDKYLFDKNAPVQPVTINVLGNDEVVTGQKDLGSVVIESAPSVGTAVVLADGTIRYTPPPTGFQRTTLTYSFRDTENHKSNIATILIGPKGQLPDPFIASIDLAPVDGQPYSEASGDFTIGRSDGIGEMLRIVGGTIRSYDDPASPRFEVTGTVYSAMPNSSAQTRPIFKGSFTVNAPSGIATVTETQVIADDFDLAGFELVANALRIEAGRVDIGGTFTFPPAWGGENVTLTALNGIAFDPTGLGFVSGSYVLPDMALSLPGGLLSVATKNVGISYDSLQDKITLRGSMAIDDKYYNEWFEYFLANKPVADAKYSTGFTSIVLDFGDATPGTSNPNYLEYAAGDLNGRGAVTIPKIKLGQGFVIKDLTGFIESTATKYAMGGGLKFGLPLAALGGTLLDPAFVGASFAFVVEPKLELDEIGFSFEGDIEIPEIPGLALTKLSGSVKGLAAGTPDQPSTSIFKIEGGIGFGYGLSHGFTVPDWIGVPPGTTFGRLSNLDVSGQLQVSRTTGEWSIGGTGTFYILSPAVYKETFGSVTGPDGFVLPLVKFSNGEVNIKGSVAVAGIFSGEATIKGDILAASDPGVLTGSANHRLLYADGTGTLAIPNLALFGPLKGQTFANALMHTDLNFDRAPGDSSIRVTTSIDLKLATTAQEGLQIFFNGDLVEFVGGQALPVVGSWAVAGDTPWIVMSAFWDNAATQSEQLVVTYREREDLPILATFTEAEFNSHGIYIVDDLTGPFARTVVVHTPLAGVWDIDLADTTGLNNVSYTAYGWTATPTVTWTGITRSGGAVPQITFKLDVADLPAGGLIDIYADTDQSGHDGVLVAAGVTPQEAAAGVVWNLADAPAGDLYFYAGISDNIHGYTYTAHTQTAVRGADVADLAVTMVRDPATPAGATSAQHTVHVSNMGPDAAAGVVVSVELADVAYTIVSLPSGMAAPTPVNGILTFKLDTLASGASFDIVLSSVGDNGGAARDLAAAAVRSLAIESDYTDNLAEFLTPGAAASTPIISISTDGSVVKAEGDAGTTGFAFTVIRTGDLTAASRVEYAVVSTSANDADFTADSRVGTVAFGAGESSKTILVAVAADTLVERDEVFTVKLRAPVNGNLMTDRASATILNDDIAAPPPPPAPVLAIATLDASKSEGDAGQTAFTFVVTRSGDVSGTSTVNYAVAGTGAFLADAADFAGGILPTGSVTFLPGETNKQIQIDIAGDSTLENSEGFKIALSNAIGATLNGSQGAATIINDDVAPPPPPPVLSIALTPGSATEGGSFALLATRAGADLSQASSASYAITGIDAADLGAPLTGTMTIAAGQTSATLVLPTIDDSLVEASETLAVALSAPVNATLGTGTASAVILDNDVAPPPVNHAPTITSGGGGAKATYIVSEGNRFITAVSAIDSDPGDKVTYSIEGATRKSAFTIDASTGVLKLKKGADDHLSYSVTVKATDASGASDTQSIKVLVADAHRMTGTADADTFVFLTDFGKQTVRGFDGAHDTLQIAASLVGGMSEKEFLSSSQVSQHGADVWIAFDCPHDDDLIILKNIQKASLTLTDFHFV